MDFRTERIRYKYMRNVIYLFKIKKMIEKIGTNAGKVWTLLDEAGTQNVKDLKKSSKLTDKDLYAALGWLAREGKITFNELKDDLQVVLL